ncbi:hypothetical protein HHI36_011570 [Cryptolaemus montrouzieri]|uniref:Uncharacterized protein n=1 Tax=Cryptolaemus montrouzieri TaxID=559131 RepID=A0ABD2MM11_9CUCU
MLHGMIPAAFFATLLRRYLDSLVETPEYATSSATFTLGTSAAFATAGIAIYGFGLLSKNQKPDELIENNKELEVTETAQEDSHRKVKKRRSRNRIRRRQHKGKQWFLKNMKHYKSKYGRKIEVVRKRSSSLDLKDLLKENFERQKNRRSSRRSSSLSERSNKSSNSQKYASNRSPRNRSRSNNSKFSSKRSTHDRANKYSHQRKDSGERNYFPNRSSTKKQEAVDLMTN